MPDTLKDIAKQLKNNKSKVQLIYAFNGVGKTRLSREFKKLIDPRNDDEQIADRQRKVIYYNAFTEDLFHWDNDIENDTEPKLKIKSNSFTNKILGQEGQDQNIITTFQKYVNNNKLTPEFKEEIAGTNRIYPEVRFYIATGDEKKSNNIKLSKGEESNFIWSIFYRLLEHIISTLDVAEVSERETGSYNQLQYIFIDDPVTSLDENHLIELAVDLAKLIKSSISNLELKFIITTHNPLFYNVLYNELNRKLNKVDKENTYLLERSEDGLFTLVGKKGSFNQSFSYHLYLKNTLETAIKNNKIQKYHFMLLRNLYEKTANFLGYKYWGDLLSNVDGDKSAYMKRIINFSSHSTLSNEEVAEPTEQEKQTVKLLLEHLIKNYSYNKEAKKSD